MKIKFRIMKALLIIIAMVLIFVVFSVSGVVIYASSNIDFDADDVLFDNAGSKKPILLYYDANGADAIDDYEPELYSEVYLDEENSVWYSYEKFSPYLTEGFIAMEDKRFLTHHGVDVKRSLGAFINYVFRGEKRFGGSTITQQVIKNISGDNERSVKRKAEEMIRAYHLEYAHSKEEILEMYLNIIPMSNNVVGVGLASKRFFGKEPKDLTPQEAATIIAIANAPTRYNPYRNPKECIEKRNRVLYVMHREGIINDKAYDKAIKSNIGVIPEQKGNPSLSSWFSETVMGDVIRDIMKKYGYSYDAARLLLSRGGYSVYTTVDPEIQMILEEYFENKDNFPAECDGGLDYSMVISDTRNSALRAIVGGVGNRNRAEVNNATALHPPGSALKPIALYLPLIDAKRITWSTVFDDIPVEFIKNSNNTYTPYPKNYPSKYDGLITVADALRVSKNTIAVRLYNMLGAESIYKYLKDNFDFESLVYSEATKNGIVTDLAPSPLALGQLSRGVSLRKLTEAYNVFPQEGNFVSGRSYIAVFDSRGRNILNSEVKNKRVCGEESARIMSQLLIGVVEDGTASKITIKNLYDTAGKTGTSGKDMDRFFIGYTPYYSAGIWCGYTDKSSSVGNHTKNHFTVWDEVMKAVHNAKLRYTDNIKGFSTEGLIYSSYCMDSGEVYSENCAYDLRGDRMAYGYFIKGTEPKEKCTRHMLVGHIGIFSGAKRISLIMHDKRDFPINIKVSDDIYSYGIGKKKKK